MRSGHHITSRLTAVFVAAALTSTGTMASVLSVASMASADSVSDQERRVQQIADELDALENRIGQLDEDHAGALDRIDALNIEIATARAGIDAQQVRLADLQGQMTSIAVDKFISGGSSGLTPLFSTASEFSEALQRSEYSRVALDQGDGTSDELRDLLSSLDDQQRALEVKIAEQAALVAQLEAQQRQGDELTKQYQDEYAAAKVELGDLIQQEQERRAAAAVAEAQAREQRQAAAARAAAVPRGGGSSGGSPSGGGGSGGGGVGSGGGGGGSTAASDSGGAADTSGSPATSEAAAPSAPAPASTSGIAVNSAYGQLGVPYRFAAESPGVAFDCSGLTKWAWGQAGVYLPHQSGAQYASSPHVNKDEAQPGDLIFYKSPIGHVAIYIGGGSLIHAPATGDVVKVSTVNWSKVVGVSRPG